MNRPLPISLLELQEAILSDVVPTQTAANATFVYAVKWREGCAFDLSKSSTKVHRARLRKLGLDIARPYSGEINSIHDKAN